MGPAIKLHALLRQAERLLAQGDGEGAMADLQQAVADYPTASLAWRRMAETLGVLGMIEEGCFAWMQAIALAPDDPIPLRGLAQTLHDLRDYAQAYPLWQQADQLEANEVRTLFHIGQCLENLQRPQEALAVVGRAHALAPLDPRPLNLLGQIEWRQGHGREAEHWLRQALALAPENAEYLTNLGVVLEALDGLDEAIELHRTAIRLDPQSLFARQNLAQALRYAGDLEGAIAVLREALALAPADANLLWSLGSLQLLKGDDEPGWRGYEARFGRNDPSRLVVDPGPGRWSGPGEAGVDPPRPLDTLVLIGEQGLGDMVQFARYAPLMHRFAERVELCVPPSLAGLIGAADLADAVRTPQQIQEHPPQAWLPLLSVPGLLGVASGEPLVQDPYLQVDRQRQHLWQQRLEHPNELLIGINWQGNPRTEMQGAFRGRSLPLEAFAPIAELPGIRLVSLQKGAGLEQLPLCSFADRFVAAQEQIDACLDFADMAAVMACCDLIISSDTVVPHLAGALGLPVWLLVPAWPNWRWGTQGESSPWYPSLKLFRQQRFGDWQAPMRAIQVALCREFAIPCPAAGGITEPSAASGFHATAGEQAGDDGGEEAPESSHEELRQQALALVAASEHRAALPLWRQLLHRQPQDLATLVSLAQCLHQLDQHQQARILSEQAHGLDPVAPGPLNLLGVLALDAGQVQEALGWLRSATERSPDNPRYLNNLAAALQQADQSDAAIELLQQALVLAPELSGIRLNLARNLSHRGDIAAALSCLLEGLEREPTNADLLWNQSLIQLLRGDYAAGWLGYEARFSTSNPVQMIGNPAGCRWPGPIGDGSQERLPTLRLVAEQGLGDMIQFARYLPLMRRYADRLEFCVPASMAQLMRNSQLADRILTPEQIRDTPAPDWLPLLSVPRLLGVSPERPLVSEPYLSSDPQRTAFWRQRLRTGAGTLVGINWQGSPNKQGGQPPEPSRVALGGAGTDRPTGGDSAGVTAEGARHGAALTLQLCRSFCRRPGSDRRPSQFQRDRRGAGLLRSVDQLRHGGAPPGGRPGTADLVAALRSRGMALGTGRRRDALVSLHAAVPPEHHGRLAGAGAAADRGTGGLAGIPGASAGWAARLNRRPAPMHPARPRLAPRPDPANPDPASRESAALLQ